MNFMELDSHKVDSNNISEAAVCSDGDILVDAGIRDTSEVMDPKREDELLQSPVKDPAAEPPCTVKESDMGTPADGETRTDLDKLIAEQQLAKYLAKRRDKRRRQAINKKAKFQAAVSEDRSVTPVPENGRGVDQGNSKEYPTTYSRSGMGGSKRPREKGKTPPGEHYKRAAEGPSQAAAQPVAKREFQVVFRSCREGGTVLEEEVETIRRHIVDEMLRAMRGPDGQPRNEELHFWNSGRVDPGWFLISAQGEESMKWLIESCPPPQIGEVRFTAMRSVDAPWSERIGFWLKSPEVDLERLKSVLEVQNRAFQVCEWKHIETTGGPGNWFVVFMVSRAVIDRLKASGWTLFYELVTLSVKRIRSCSSTARQGTSSDLSPAPPRK